jgi:NAD+ kinase
MTSAFKTIGLIGKHRTYNIEDTFSQLVDYLQSLQLDILLDEETARGLTHKYSIAQTNKIRLGAESDLIIAIGGDGCFLNAARVAAPHNTPIIGINRGRLGFLTDIMPDQLATQIDAVLAGNYQEEQRFLISCTLSDAENALSEGDALNDIVLSPGNSAHMIDFAIYIDQELMCRQRADGLIVATPTGSTAYALSAGGPILHPQLDALAIVPMFPQALGSRPIVIHGNSQIEIVISEQSEVSPCVSCDGQAHVPIPPGGRIKIYKMPQPLRLLHPNHYDFYQTLRSKLGWERE